MTALWVVSLIALGAGVAALVILYKAVLPSVLDYKQERHERVRERLGLKRDEPVPPRQVKVSDYRRLRRRS